MSSIKLISPETDLSKVKMRELDWDVVVRGKEYKCFRIPGYVHTIGGQYGENEYWACPRDEEPTVDNLIEFDGEPVRYSIVIDNSNYIKTKWDETEIRNNVLCRILRNDKDFYSFGSSDIPFAYAKAYYLITLIRESVINFYEYNYAEKEIIGRHIWWKRKPYTLCTYIEGQCCAMAVPGHIDNPNDYYNDSSMYNVSVKLDLLADKHIGWFCEDY